MEAAGLAEEDRASPITAIMKASTVPSAAPLARSAWTTGTTPAAFE